jgi:hypothetical protein
VKGNDSIATAVGGIDNIVRVFGNRSKATQFGGSNQTVVANGDDVTKP